MPRWEKAQFANDNDLTPRQAQVLRAVKFFEQQHGHPPNYGELAALLKIRYSAAHRHIHRLAEKGQVKVLPRSPNRSYRVLETGA